MRKTLDGYKKRTVSNIGIKVGQKTLTMLVSQMLARQIPGSSSLSKTPRVAREGAATSMIMGVGGGVVAVSDISCTTRRIQPMVSARSVVRRILSGMSSEGLRLLTRSVR